MATQTALPESTEEPTLVPSPIPTQPPSPIPSPTPVQGDLIINMICYDSENATDWYVRINIQEGDYLFGDRSYTIVTLPSFYMGSDWIRTACDSKNYTDDILVTFTVTRDAIVYVVHDDRINVPDWLSLWTDTTDNLVDSEPFNFNIYSKAFTADSLVSLGNNGICSSCCGYSIIVKDAGI